MDTALKVHRGFVFFCLGFSVYCLGFGIFTGAAAPIVVGAICIVINLANIAWSRHNLWSNP